MTPCFVIAVSQNPEHSEGEGKRSNLFGSRQEYDRSD